MESIRPQDVGQFTRCVSLKPVFHGCPFAGGMGEHFCRDVDCVGQTCFLRWVVSSTGGNDDACVVCEVWREEMVEKCVADMRNAEGLLDPVVGKV